MTGMQRQTWAGLGQPIRYALIGAGCAAAHNIIWIGGDLAGFHYLPLTILSNLLVTPAAFWLHARFTFAAPATRSGLVRFSFALVLGYAISLLAMALFRDALQLPMLLAGPLVTILMLAWNFGAARVAIVGRLRGAPGAV